MFIVYCVVDDRDALIEQLKLQLQEQKEKIDEFQKHKNTSKGRMQYYDLQDSWTHLDHWCNNYAREDLFHKVKFITNEAQLRDYKEEGSIGYAFLAKYKYNHQMAEDVSEDYCTKLWMDAKERIRRSINRKRSNVCNQLKQQFKCKCISNLHFITFWHY